MKKILNSKDRKVTLISLLIAIIVCIVVLLLFLFILYNNPNTLNQYSSTKKIIIDNIECCLLSRTEGSFSQYPTLFIEENYCIDGISYLLIKKNTDIFLIPRYKENVDSNYPTPIKCKCSKTQ